MPIYEIIKEGTGEVIDLIESYDAFSAQSSFLDKSDLTECAIRVRQFAPTIVARSFGTTSIGHRYFHEYILLTRGDGTLSNRTAKLWLKDQRYLNFTQPRLKVSQIGYIVEVETPHEEYGESRYEILCIATCRKHYKIEDEDDAKPKPLLDDDIPF